MDDEETYTEFHEALPDEEYLVGEEDYHEVYKPTGRAPLPPIAPLLVSFHAREHSHEQKQGAVLRYGKLTGQNDLLVQ